MALSAGATAFWWQEQGPGRTKQLQEQGPGGGQAGSGALQERDLSVLEPWLLQEQGPGGARQ